MVHITSIISAVALFSTLASGLPSMPRRRQDDSAIGLEVAVSAPNGIPITNSAELTSQLAREAGQTAAAPAVTVAGGNYGAQQMGAYPPVVSSPAAHTVAAPAHQVTTSPAHVPPPVTHAPPPVAHVTTSVAAHVTSSVAAHVTTPPAHVTTSQAALPTYGSGSANWQDANSYQECVQQCVATYGSAPVSYKPTATNTANYGTGATHTVIVAPTQGVLRYIPFAVNATVGDTIKFMWGANNHTVTKSSALLPCNRSGDALFASGTQNKDFVFTQVVNETSPTYFFCATATHCQKGMFGIVNPTTNFDAATTFSKQISGIAANNSDVQSYVAYTRQQTASNNLAGRWGSNIDMAAFPDWAQSVVAENVLYTRNFLAANPEVLKEDGSIDLSTAGSTPLAIPQDLAAALASASAPATTIAAPTATSSAPAETATTGTPESLNNNGAMSSTSPRLLVAGMAILATYILL
ncbi:hypothetical protein EST38_g1725 [Candolleomyces aberdarensis]|uniref:Extracellular serine-rich protein n=1 Tax=Candolleomyces aberdarensis TaxID=2316362 RepID=A0A4Q2DUB0_9AGAR|nr:hypothetical protein EST38_g1725 [Candolleomyces aberdarensis]